jgi:bifunctional DNA primase/polymerase-like protein
MIADEITAALVTALELGLPAFPCRADKAPTCPTGFRAAISEPAALRELWRCYPGPLIGVPTGAQSGIDALDIDGPRHVEAAVWWEKIAPRLPPTRIHRTRSSGVHVLFRHQPGLRCWAGRPVPGIDGRADGGYAVWWPGVGLPVLCDAPPAEWPEWLLAELTPKEAPSRSCRSPATFAGLSDRYVETALNSAVERVSSAPVGTRNATLNAELFSLCRFVQAGALDGQVLANGLASAALSAGLSPREIEATLRSAFRARGVL